MENLPTKANYSVEAQKQKKNYEIMKRYGSIADYLCFFFFLDRENKCFKLFGKAQICIHINTYLSVFTLIG